MKVYTLHKNTVAYKYFGFKTGINFGDLSEFVQFRSHLTKILCQTGSYQRLRQLRNPQVRWSYKREAMHGPYLMYFRDESDITLALLTWNGKNANN